MSGSSKFWIDDRMYPVDDEVSEYIEQLQAKLKKTQWIPVSERLPEDGKNVLVAIKFPDYESWCSSVESYSVERGWILGDDQVLDESQEEYQKFITHWKPIILPKFPT